MKNDILDFKRIITDKDYRFLFFQSRGFYKHLSDEEILKRIYRCKVGEELNLVEPHKLSEKIQWLKLHDRNRLYYTLSDRYEVKKWVDQRIGGGHVIDSYGVWRFVDDIEYFRCPSKFILKITNNPEATFYCDKNQTDFKKMKRRMRRDLSNSVYWQGRDWAYQFVDRRIMAEEYIPDIWEKDSVKYRITCFNGNAEIVTVYKRIADNERSFGVCGNYDREWNKLPFCRNDSISEGDVSRSNNLGEMILCAESLARGIPFVVIDFYCVAGKYIVEGMLLYPYSGFFIIEPEEWDLILGEKLDLSGFDARIIDFPTERVKRDN